MADADGVQYTCPRLAPRGVDRPQQVRDRGLLKSVERQQLLAPVGEPVDVGDVAHQPHLEEAHHGLGPEAFDVHRPA